MLLAIAILSLALITAAVIDAFADCRALMRLGTFTGVRRLVAQKGLRRNVVSLFIAAVMVGVVCYSARHSRGADAETMRDILDVRNKWAAVAILLLALNSAWDLVDAKRLRQLSAWLAVSGLPRRADNLERSNPAPRRLPCRDGPHWGRVG
jgi:hypothetical protein